MGSFGLVTPPRYKIHTRATSEEALELLREVTVSSIRTEIVRKTALQIVNPLRSRDDDAELQAIYDSVKHGNKRVPPLANGVRYVSDPDDMDHFTAPHRILEMCLEDACGEDCDGIASLICALGSSIGFRMGLRAWGPEPSGDFEHVYAVAWFPKHAHAEGHAMGLDTTVDEADLGWEPPKSGRFATAWLGGNPRSAQ